MCNSKLSKQHKNAVVTGGTGFIGSWLIEELLYNGYYVTIIVRNRLRLLSKYINNPYCRIIEKDYEMLKREDFENEEYDYFFNLAWGGVSTKEKNDLSLQLKNINISLKLLELCNAIKCQKFISTGTVAEYVFSSDVMDFELRQTPNDMYGAAKVSTHYFLEVRARQLDQKFNWIVIPSTFGERRGDDNIIMYTINCLLSGDTPKYGELTQMWDFLYVSEVVRALRLIAEKGMPEKVYGIGSGEYYPLKHYIEKIRDLINPDASLGIGVFPQMSKQAFSSCVNIDELKKDTGFVPSVDFETGIRKTIEWVKETKSSHE